MIEPPRYPIRVLSDLHLGNRASLVGSAGSVAPLFQGMGTVILNGDTFDLRHAQRRAPGPPASCPFEDLAGKSGSTVIKIAGNHDPDCSPIYHLELAAGQILITHGDVLYPEIAPWSRFAAQFRRMIENELEELQNPGSHTLEHLLETNKKVAREILNQPHFYFPTNEPFPRHLLRYLWPPFRILRILGSWWRLPRSATALAETHRPGSRFIILGHTHYPGVWKRGGRTIINTGSYLPLLGRRCVDIHPDRIELRRIRHRNDQFHAGRISRTWTIRDANASPDWLR
ncbi:MAG: metallophosphoesterase family protein [Opitutaceae bacterium]